MFYELDVVVPHLTLVTAPVLTSMPLAAGTVTYVEVQFPAGCVGLVHAKVREGLHQVWPSNSDGNIKGDNARVAFDEQHELAAKPWTLTLVTWSDDDTFDHTLTFRFTVKPKADADLQRSALNALLYLDKWFSSQQPPHAGGAQP